MRLPYCSIYGTRRPAFLILVITVLSLLLPPTARASSIGIMTTGSQTWGAGSGIFWDINEAPGSAGVNWDLISVNGALTIAATAQDPFTIHVFSLEADNQPGLAEFDPAEDYSFTFLTTTLGITNFNTSAFTFNLSNFQNPFDGTWSVTQGGNNLALNYTAVGSAIPVPDGESHVLVLAGLALIAAHGFRSRRTARAIAARTP